MRKPRGGSASIASTQATKARSRCSRGGAASTFCPAITEEPVKFIKNDAIQATLSSATRSDPTRVWTVGQAAEHLAIGGASPALLGSAGAVGYEVQTLVRRT